MHLYFGDKTDKENIDNLLRQALIEKQAMYDDLDQKLKQLDCKLSPYQKLCMELGLVQYEAFIKKFKVCWSLNKDHVGSRFPIILGDLLLFCCAIIKKNRQHAQIVLAVPVLF